MRLIDADELRRRIIAFSAGSHTTYLTVENIVMMINQADTADAVPVVRCKECKHMRRDNVGVFYKVWHGYNGCGEDGFCSYGERRADNDV